jgi:5-methylcytosine-specific restriction protein A
MPFKPKKKQTSQYSQGRVGNFYQSRTWRNLRDHFIKLNPLCVECAKINIFVPANIVDHIKPISEGGSELDSNNLQSLCKSCHAVKTGKETKQRNRWKTLMY